MENVKIELKHELKYFLIAYIGSLIVVILLKYFQVIIPLTFFTLLFYFMILLSNYFRYSSIWFSPNGIFLNRFIQKEEISWENIRIEKVNTFKKQITITLKSDKHRKKIHINYINQFSIIALTKKYCPENHELYKLIQNFSKTIIKSNT